MNNEKIIAWAVMKDGECLSVRRFEPVASGEAEGVEFVPLVRFAEQPAQQEPGRNHYEDGDVFERIAAMKRQPAQQEPVAWIDEYGNAFPLAAKQYSVVGKHWKPLYTSTPAQRTWVGLTDEEVDQGLLRSDYAFKTAEAWRAGVVFAMTKLKEKNT